MNQRGGPKKLSPGTALKVKKKQMNWGVPVEKKAVLTEA